MNEYEFNDLRFRVEVLERLVNRFAEALDEMYEEQLDYDAEQGALAELDDEEEIKRRRAAWDGR